MNVLQQIRDWTVSSTAPSQTVIDESKLSGLATWMAGAFTLLAGILTFFGVKEGLLDRLLRTTPRPAILVFCLLGVAVFAGMVAPVLKVQGRIRAVVVLAGIGLLGGVVLLALPDIAPGEDEWIGVALPLIVVSVGLAAGLLLWGAMIPLIAGALMVGLACLSFGLYGAVKLSVASKLDSEEALVAAEVKGAPGPERIVAVTVAAAKMDSSQHLEVAVVSSRGNDGDRDIGRARVYPDAAGAASKTLQFSLPNERLEGVSVRSRVCRISDCVLSGDHERTFLRLSGPRDLSFVGGSVSPSTGPTTAALSVQSATLPRDISLSVALMETSTSGGTVERVTARLMPDAHGSIAWTISATVQGQPGNVLQLKSSRCPANGECEKQGVVLATYTYPAGRALELDRPN